MSSLLSFFVGLVERVLSFEKSILRQPVVFKHKYVKQVLVFAASLLFLLSSIEWTVGQSSGVMVSETQAVVVNERADETNEPVSETNEPVGDAVTVFAWRQVPASFQTPGTDFFPPGRPDYKTPPKARDYWVTGLLVEKVIKRVILVLNFEDLTDTRQTSLDRW